MAIQNFLSGGYYGKLGDTVGQRWHNKRTIRAHVIPKNPRTEKQQANRQLFAHATKLAQIAFRANKGSPLWDTSEKGQFSQLVQVALRRLKAGMSDAEAIPLYPDGYDPSITLGNISDDWSAWPTSVTITANSHVMNNTRRFEIMIYCRDETIGSWVYLTDIVEIPSGSYFSYTFNQEFQYSMPQGSTITAASLDDLNFGGVSISLPTFDLEQIDLPWMHITVTWTSHSYDSNTGIMTIYGKSSITNNPIYLDPDVEVWNAEYNSFVYGEYEGFWKAPDIVYIPLTYEPEIEYPQGCYVHAGNIDEGENGIFYYTMTWPRYNFSW